MKLMKRALIVWGAWTAVALLFSIQMHFQTTSSVPPDPRSWSWILAWQLSGWWCWALFTAPVCAFAAWAVRIRRPVLRIAAHVPMALATAVACAGFEGGLKWALGLWRTPHTLVTGIWDGIGIWWTFNVLVYAMVAGLYHAWRATRLEMQLVQARLDALVGQLQPHFLFNTLSATAELVHADPHAADVMITRLGDFLRLSLDHAGHLVVPFRQEIDFIRAYVDIEQVRWGDRLVVEWDCSPDTLDAAVPTLAWQPVLENAIRHGRDPRSGIARIHLGSRREGLHVVLFVRDSGPGLPAGRIEEHLGLRNTRERVERLYGDNARFELANAAGGGAIATLRLPYTPCAAAHTPLPLRTMELGEAG
jgi:hypothetical protein